MSDLKVNFSALATASADITAGANQIESRLADMDASLQPLRARSRGWQAQRSLVRKR